MFILFFQFMFNNTSWLKVFWKGSQHKGIIANTLAKYFQQTKWGNDFWQKDPSFIKTLYGANYPFYKVLWP
jgi:hypothetical protein